MNRLLSLGVALLLTAGCNIDDADPRAAAAITSLTASASTDLVSARQSHVTGTITLGYTANQLVQVRVLDDGVPVYATSLAAEGLELTIDATVELTHQAENALTVEAEYNGQKAQQKLLVVVPDALQAFTLTPAASAVNVYEVELTGQLDVGFSSAQAATLEISVEGAIVHRQSFDVATALSQPIALTVPLAREGANAITAIVRYGGHELTRQLAVAVAMDAPKLTFPSWTNVYTPHLGLVASGDLTVQTDPAYAIDEVSFSVDGRAFEPATRVAEGSYHADIVDPDIGASDVTVRVATSNDGHRGVTEFHGALAVEPVFDCANPAAAMLPSTTLLQNNRTENREMVGYFGDPAGGHQVSFVLRANVTGSGAVIVGSTTTTYGSTTIGAAFGVDQLRCQNEPCTLSYNLEAWVDGVQLCSKPSFGLVQRF